jgi:SulP family sulfate permease
MRRSRLFPRSFLLFPTLRSWFQQLRDFAQDGRALLRSVVADSALDPFPLRRTLLGYGKRSFMADLRAGVSVSLLDIPQGMAYALIAGLPLQYGITCSAVAALVGRCSPPHATRSLGRRMRRRSWCSPISRRIPTLDRIGMMPLLVFMTAALLIAGAFLRVADLTQFISRTVVVAYVTGASILITVNQLPVLLGIPAEVLQASGKPVIITFPGHVHRILTHLDHAGWLSITFSVLTLASFLSLKRWLPRWPAFAVTLVTSPRSR